MLVKEWLINIGAANEFSDVIEKFGHLEIKEEFGGTEGRQIAFPQRNFTHRNVHVWVLLSDGSAIGWNESPRSGWSFPRIGAKTVNSILGK